MKQFCLSLVLLAFFTLAAVGQQKGTIIPQPVSVQMGEGNFEITEKTTISFNADQPELEQAARFFTKAIEKISGYDLKLNKGQAQDIQLSLSKAESLGQEGYRLLVTPSHIEIVANAKAGIIYGLQSVLQMLPPIRTNAPLVLPSLEIEDYPRFKWRGMHLDVSRHFFGPEVIKEYIDLMASYKMNVFHWHLVDDTGWRIEIKQYPKLTDIGAWRVDYNHLPWTERPQAKAGQVPTYGGYYTQEQVREIIAYASERNITIVPEIEMPGHVASAIASYPEFSCNKQAQLPLTGGNYDNIYSNYCAGDDAVFTFLENILTEVIDLFPSEYIHIGGDEVNKESWTKCASCQKRMKSEGLKDENELQSYFIKRIEKFLVSKNRKLIGWDEILEGGLAPQATVMSWRGEKGGIEAANMGHDVVMTPGKPCYFDHYQAGPAGEPLAIGGFNTLKTVYDYEPVPAELSQKNAGHVLGAQANVWTEFITTVEHLEYMVLPRMAALAEVVWTPQENKDWSSFNQRIRKQFKVYEQKGLNYCVGNATVAIQPVSEGGQLTVELSTELPGAEIVYTLDGEDPTVESQKYTAPLVIDASVQLKASSVVNGKVMGMAPNSQYFVMHEAIGHAVEYKNAFSSSYKADGPNSLTDGVRGTTNVVQYWHGFNGQDVEATIDLGQVTDVKRITLGCLQKYRDWIFMPQEVVFEVSLDGRRFKKVGTISNPIAPSSEEVIHDFTIDLNAKQARYIRVKAQSNVCPQGHNGEGKPAWVFVDELIVE